MADMTLDLTDYFARIGYRGAADPTLDVLQDLITAHTRAIAFENLDPLLGVPVDDLGPEALFDKLIRRRRGGYCYEHNGLLGYVLAELGFGVRRFAARVVWTVPPGSPVPSQTHTLLGVAPANAPQLFLVDVGFGGQTPTSPLRLETGTVQPTTHEPYRLQSRGDTLVLQAEIRRPVAVVVRVRHQDSASDRSPGGQLVCRYAPVVAFCDQADRFAGHRRRTVQPVGSPTFHPPRRPDGKDRAA
jgi:arylamine N-acetyltransferase